MIYTLNYLKDHEKEPLKFTLDFSKEVKDLIMVKQIGECNVTGTYVFTQERYIELQLDVKAEIIMLTSDTLKPIEVDVEFTLIDEVSDSIETEYQIKDEEVDFYELVWGWFITEIPHWVSEKD